MSSTPPLRRLTLVGSLEGDRRAVHTTGFPLDAEQLLPLADVLLLIGDADGPGAMLFRYTAHGELGGDTWHPSLEGALDQASFEYGDAILGWTDIPEDVADSHHFAIRVAAERLDERR